LGLFIYGALHLGPLHGVVLSIMVIFYWIVSGFSLFLPMIPVHKMIEKEYDMKGLQNTLALITKSLDEKYVYFNVIEDIIIAGILSYFGYNFLAVAYSLHIFGYAILFFNVRSYIVKKIGPVKWAAFEGNFKKAFEKGDRYFSILNLTKDPKEELLKKIR
jgi:hypothetical protein